MSEKVNKRWFCTVCAYVHVAPEPPDICPVCSAMSDAFIEDTGEDQKSEGTATWIKVAEPGALKEGGSTVVTAGGRSIALTLVGGRYGAIDNDCPHQGGPLGEGTLDEQGNLRCPWHGWGFCPKTGKGDGVPDVRSYPVEVRSDGVHVQVEETAPAASTISDIMARTMVNWGITHVFGMVGHSNLGFAEAIRKLVAGGKLTYIGVRHEGAAAFACSGFAKASGRPAACLTIAGPGATNLLTGLWDARMDRAPVLALTGQVNTQVLGPGAFQEIDISSAFEAVAAWSQTVLPGSKPAELMSLAVKYALVNRDVAHLILPNEVQVLPAPADASPAGPEGRLSEVEITPARASLEKAAGLIAGARRPAIIAGHGARGSMDSIIPLAERLGAPVITTFKGKGLIGDDHPLATGVLGRSGTPVSSRCMNDSDLLMVFGASFAVHTGIDKNKPTIQVDYDRNALARFHPLTLPVWGEIGVTGKLLLERLPGEIAAEDQREKIARLWAQWRAEKDRRASRDQGRGMSSAAIFQHLASGIPEDAILSVDVGNNTYSFGRYFECKRQAVILSGYLGSIGFGFPAAMGAWAAHPGKPIVCICGDGGFGQYMAEFTTAVKYKMNITLFLLNNHELGKISKEQRDENWEVWETSLHNPSFAKYAGNCGGLGIGINDAKDLPAAIREALEYQGPSIVEIFSDPELI